MKNNHSTKHYDQTSRRKPAMHLLLASSDRDPAAVTIKVTPVDLSDTSCCPFCGTKQHDRDKYRGR
jgi:hypothetical protein